MVDFGQASKIGFSNSIGTGNFVILSNASVVNPIGTGERANIVSTSASDTSAGTGVQKVKITYFDNSWTLKSEVVTMNGITIIPTVATDIFRIEAFEAFQIGTGTIGAVGTITLKSLDGTRLFAQIDPTNSTFTRALHFVAPGRMGRIIELVANGISSGGIVFLAFVTKDNTLEGGGPIIIPDTAFSIINGTVQIPFISPITCNASQSTQGLMMGIAVKGLAPSQIGIASFHFEDFSVT